jgi:hypothetical protein
VTTGKALFALDAFVMLCVWPVMLHLACYGDVCFEVSPDGLAAVLYPAADLICLYALGLYRRDAIIDTRESMARVPLAVSLGAVSTACCLLVLDTWVGQPDNRGSACAASQQGLRSGCSSAAGRSGGVC